MKLEDIAGVIRKDDTTACKVRSNERPCTLSEFTALVDLAGLKFVDKTRYCVTLEEFNFMRRTTARALANEAMASSLFLEDGQ